MSLLSSASLSFAIVLRLPLCRRTLPPRTNRITIRPTIGPTVGPIYLNGLYDSSSRPTSSRAQSHDSSGAKRFAFRYSTVARSFVPLRRPHFKFRRRLRRRTLDRLLQRSSTARRPVRLLGRSSFRQFRSGLVRFRFYCPRSGAGY